MRYDLKAIRLNILKDELSECIQNPNALHLPKVNIYNQIIFEYDNRTYYFSESGDVRPLSEHNSHRDDLIAKTMSKKNVKEALFNLVKLLQE